MLHQTAARQLRRARFTGGSNSQARKDLLRSRCAIRVGRWTLLALAFAPIPAAFAVCNATAPDCEILVDTTFSAPHTYDYTAWSSVTVKASGNRPSATLTQTGGTFTASSLLLYKEGYYNMTGGTATFSDRLIVGGGASSPAYAAFWQSGGTVNVGARLLLASYHGSIGTYNFNGGNLNVDGLVHLVDIGATDASASFNLNAGTLTTNQIKRDGDGTQSLPNYRTRAEFHFNGGTLRADDTDNPNWIIFSNGASFRENVSVLSIDAGGARFDTNGRNMGIAVALPGSGGLIKRGAGTLTLSGGNSYSGRTGIEAGTLAVSASNNLGAPNNAFGLYGGTLRVTGSGFTGLDSRNVDPTNFGGAIDIADAGTTFTLPQSVGNSNNTTFTKMGAGTLVLGGQNSWTGGTTVNAGTLRLAATATGGIGTLRGPLVINNATVDLAVVDALGYAANAKVNSIAINGGTLINNSAGNNGWGISYSLNGGTLRSNGGIADPQASSLFSFGGPGNANTSVNVSGTAPSTISGHIDLRGDNGNSNVNVGVDNGATLNIVAAFSSTRGSNSTPTGFTKLGGGLLALQAANAHSGDTALAAGTLALDHANALQASTAVLNGGVLSFRAIGDATFGGLAGSQSLLLQNSTNDPVSLSVGASNANTAYSGALTGTGSLTKIGSGTLTLGGTSSHTGTTTVSAGTLRINGVSGTGALGVASGATLSGNGRVAGAATAHSGSHLAPGNSLGTLTFSNGLSLNGGAQLDLDLGSSSDLIRVSGGAFSAAAGVVLNVSSSAGYGVGSYTLIDFTDATPNGISAANFTFGVVPPPYGYHLSIQGTKLMLTVDLAPAVVTGASVPADGAYGLGKPLDVSVHFDKPVIVTGVPRLPIFLNSGTLYASYVSGSATADLLFRATVAPGNNDNDGITLATALDANGGTLRDAAGTDADRSLHNVPSTNGVTVDSIAPSASAIHLIGSPPPTSLSVSYSVTFSESVSGVDATDFSVVAIDGTVTAQVDSVSGSGGSYTVIMNRVGGVGHLLLSLKNSGTGIADLAGNPISGGFSSGDVFAADVRRRCYVNNAALGTNDATSWTDAYASLQTALHDLGCAEIWTARGIYKPGSANTDSFRPRAGVRFYGGFAGSESTLAQRSAAVIAANPTVLSGDISNNDKTDADGVVLDATQIFGTNSINVIRMDNAPATGYASDTVIDGFIITAAGDGGLRCDASPTLSHCDFTLGNLVFSGNRGSHGGALSLAVSTGSTSPVLSNILFRGNRATDFGGAVAISATDANGSASPTFSNVIFSGNHALALGGAVRLSAVPAGSITPTFDHVTFTGNTSATHRGGAVASLAAKSATAVPTLRNTILWDNDDSEIALDGSGVAVLDHVLVQDGCPAGGTCTNLIAGDPQLGALGNHGGAVPSMLPGLGGAAVDAATCTVADDIRGIARPQGTGCDIGAVESRQQILDATVDGGGSVSAGAAPLAISGGIDHCTDHCSAMYDGETPATVTLTATPSADRFFSSWSGNCSGSSAVIAVTMTAPKHCTATFAPNLTQIALVASIGTNPSAYGAPLGFTATVTAAPPALAAPTGSVSFYDGAVPLATVSLASDGSATFTTSALNAGTHSITARYNGDANYAALAQSPSAAVLQSVMTTTPSLVWTAPPAIVYGTALSAAQLSASANAGGTPLAGSFVYTPHAGTVLGAGTQQTLSVTFTPTDTTNHTVATASVLIDVTRAPSSTGVASSANPSVYGQSITLTATVTSSANGIVPTGTVSFVDGAIPLCQPRPIANDGRATCSTSLLDAGMHTISLIYSGDANNASSTSVHLQQQVNRAGSQTVLDSGCTSRTLVEGEPYTLIAGPTVGSGSVKFATRMGQLLCDFTPLQQGLVQCITNALITTASVAAESVDIVASYGGDTQYAPSDSQPMTLMVLDAHEAIFRNAFEAAEPNCPSN